jgi:hypothetical protein
MSIPRLGEQNGVFLDLLNRARGQQTAKPTQSINTNLMAAKDQ